MEILDLIVREGLVRWPLLVLALVVVWIGGERWLLLRRSRLDVGQFMLKLRTIYRHGGLTALRAFLDQKAGPIPLLLRRGVDMHGEREDHLREGLESAARDQIAVLERRIPVLASIASAGPLLGFLGTVLGFIVVLESSPAGIGPGIREALIDSAIGLALGLMASLVYNHLVHMVRVIVHGMDTAAHDFLVLLREPVLTAPMRESVLPVSFGAPLHHADLAEPDVFRQKEQTSNAV